MISSNSTVYKPRPHHIYINYQQTLTMMFFQTFTPTREIVVSIRFDFSRCYFIAKSADFAYNVDLFVWLDVDFRSIFEVLPMNIGNKSTSI